VATVAEAMAGFLARHGVELVVGQSLPSAFHLAVADTAMRQIQVRTENAGTAICDGYARLSKRVAVMTAQNGPAATLLVPGLAEALKASIPIVAIVQDVPASQRDRNAFQEYDHQLLFASCAKWVRRLDASERVYDYVNLALTQATSGRPGPVVLLVAQDVLLEEAPPAPAILQCRATFPLDRAIADPRQIDQAASLIAAAERPLVVAGGGAHLSGAGPELVRLQEDFDVPVATTIMGKGVVDEAHPLSLGVVGYLLGKTAPNRAQRAYCETADVVFFVGARTNQNGTDSWTLFDPASRFIHLDIDGCEIGRNYESLRLAGDAKLTLVSLMEALRRTGCSPDRDRRERLQPLLARGEILSPVESKAAGLRPESVVAAVNERLGPGDVFVADASYSSGWMAAFGRAGAPDCRFLSPRGMAGLGWGLPYMLGAKLARPDARVIGLTGDGGFAHVWSELETARRHDIAAVCIVLKNGVLGYQRDAELVKFGRHTNAIPLGEIDHAAIARACRCVGLSVDHPEQLDSALDEALAAQTVAVLDVRTDPAAYPPVTLLDALTAEEESTRNRVPERA